MISVRGNLRQSSIDNPHTGNIGHKTQNNPQPRATLVTIPRHRQHWSQDTEHRLPKPKRQSSIDNPQPQATLVTRHRLPKPKKKTNAKTFF